MNFLPQHWLRLNFGPGSALTESVAVVGRREIRSAKPLFRAPALPTPHQFSRELPFTAELRPRAPGR